jgi:MoaA/NifB/PqqE/SkfB family radical SAM enzyme
VNGDFFLCYFETTRRCNLRCAYCMSRPAQGEAGPELSTEEAKALVLDELPKVSPNAAVAFSGGEHLLRADAYELLAHAARRGLCSFINTNGRLLLEGDAIAKSLRATEGRVVFVLPLNALDTEVNRAGRDDDPSVVLAAAEACRKHGAPYFFLVTISRQNLAELDKTVRFLKDNRLPMLRAPFVPRGAGERFRHLLFDAADMQKVIHPVLTANPLAYISFTPFFVSPEALATEWRRLKVRIAGLGCQAGRGFAAVSAEGGTAAPCVGTCAGNRFRRSSFARRSSRRSANGRPSAGAAGAAATSIPAAAAAPWPITIRETSWARTPRASSSRTGRRHVRSWRRSRRRRPAASSRS